MSVAKAVWFYPDDKNALKPALRVVRLSRSNLFTATQRIRGAGLIIDQAAGMNAAPMSSIPTV